MPEKIIYGYQRTHKPMRKEGRTMANEQNTKRARRNVYGIVLTNWTEYSKMLTLTYAKPTWDYDKLAHDFKMLIQALKRKGYEFPYLWVVEKHNSEKTAPERLNSLHLHVLIFSDRFIPQDIIAKHWHGHVKINTSINKAKNKGAYVAKYIQKDTLPPDKKAYRTSRKIKRPTIRKLQGESTEIARTVNPNHWTVKSNYDYNLKKQENQLNQSTGELEPKTVESDLKVKVTNYVPKNE